MVEHTSLRPGGSAGHDAEDLERRQRFAALGEDERRLIDEIKPAMLDHLGEHVEAFYAYLSRHAEAQSLLQRPEILQEARRLEHDHLTAMVAGGYGQDYVDQRYRLGQLYNRAQLPMALFMAAYHAQMSSIGRRIMARYPTDSTVAFDHFTAFKRLAFYDLGVIVDSMMEDREQTILRQQEAIRELSTPALLLRERLLILPIIGLLDSHRAKQLTEGLLHAIREHRAKVVVMDLTGVATVDSKVANHLIQTVAAARLMGARVIVTGLSGDVAQSLVTLGVDLSILTTVGDLQGGIEEAERILAPLATESAQQGVD
jgi:rsbT co-antagonist protein RsbR